MSIAIRSELADGAQPEHGVGGASVSLESSGCRLGGTVALGLREMLDLLPSGMETVVDICGWVRQRLGAMDSGEDTTLL